MGWTFLYLMLFLKLPILALLGIVWWAIRQTNDATPNTGGDGGLRDPHRIRPRDPRRPPPRPGCAPRWPARARSSAEHRARLPHLIR